MGRYLQTSWDSIHKMTYKVENISYGNSVLDIYMPYWTKKPWPCIFSIHSGGWATGNEDEGPGLCHLY